MPRVYIAQLKCPAGHCVLALAGEYENQPDAAAELSYRLGHMFASLTNDKVLKHECGLCHATDLHIEIGRTKWSTMAEAKPFIKQSEAAQQATVRMLKEGRN